MLKEALLKNPLVDDIVNCPSSTVNVISSRIYATDNPGGAVWPEILGFRGEVVVDGIPARLYYTEFGYSCNLIILSRPVSYDGSYSGTRFYCTSLEPDSEYTNIVFRHSNAR